MPNDTNNFDPDDLGLKAVMGERFHDETAESSTAAKTKAKATNTSNTEKTAHKPMQKPTSDFKADATWKPEKPEPNWMDNLKDSVKWVALFGSLNFLIFYWQQAELMDSSIATPCTWVCLVLCGYFIGKCARKVSRQ